MLSITNARFVLAAFTAVSLCGCPRALPPSISVNDSTIASVRGVLEEGVSSADSGAVEALADPTGFATLSGTFKISGTAPPNPALPVTKDVEVCAPGGTQVLDEIVMVGPDSGLRNVLVYVSSKIPSEWIDESYAAARGAEVIFDQKNCVFLTRMGVMWTEQKMKILNSDPVAHNTNFASKRGAKAQDVLIPGNGYAPYETESPSPAPFSVSCAIHPWMKASMMVCDHPYFAVTDSSGAFSIANLPAGVELEFRVWHEKAGYIQAVTVDSTSEKWSKGRFNRTLSDGDDATMNVVIEASAFQ